MSMLDTLIKDYSKTKNKMLDETIIRDDDKIKVTVSVLDNSVNNKNYYSYNIYVIQNNINIRLVEIRSKLFSLQFLKGLVEYYENIIESIANDHNNMSKFETIMMSAPKYVEDLINNEYISSWKFLINNKADVYLRKNKNKEFAHEMMIKFLALYSNFYNDDEELDDLVKQHTTHYPKNKDYINGAKNDFYKYVFPGITELNEDEFRTINYYVYECPKANIKDIKLSYKLNKLIKVRSEDFYNKYKDVKIKNIDVKEIDNTTNTYDSNVNYGSSNPKSANLRYCVPKYASDIFYIMKNSDEMQEFLNNLTYKDYDEFFYYIYELKYYDEAYNELVKLYDQMKDDLHADVKNAHAVLISKVVNKDRDSVKNFYDSFYRDYEYDYYMLKVFTEYLETFEDDTLTDEELTLLYRIMNSRKIWITKPILAESIVKQLYKKNNNATDIINLLKEAYINKVKMSVSKWDMFIDNYDDYKDMPVSWWKPLI